MRTSSKSFVLSLVLVGVVASRAAAQSGLAVPDFSQDTLLSSSAEQHPDKKRLKESLAKIQIPFIAGQGPDVAYYASTFAGTVYVTPDGKIVYSLQGKAGRGRPNADSGELLHR